VLAIRYADNGRACAVRRECGSTRCAAQVIEAQDQVLGRSRLKVNSGQFCADAADSTAEINLCNASSGRIAAEAGGMAGVAGLEPDSYVRRDSAKCGFRP